MGSGSYALILFLGVIIVLVDGQLILRTSAGYLSDAYADPHRARQVSGLTTVLFHLVMLGVVLLVAATGVSTDAGIAPILFRIGVLLLLTAIAHGVTMAILSRMRQQQLDSQVLESQVNAANAASSARRGIRRRPGRGRPLPDGPPSQVGEAAATGDIGQRSGPTERPQAEQA
jgi:hypothetical protein